MGNSHIGNSSNAKPDFPLRTQFTFFVDDITLSCILSRIAENTVNIAGFFATRIASDNYQVRMVVGSSVSENRRELDVVRKTLDCFHVCFEEEKVIAITSIPAGIPGGYNRVIGALWCKVELKAFYVGEDNVIYLNVSDIHKAMDILSQDPIKQCPKRCC